MPELAGAFGDLGGLGGDFAGFGGDIGGFGGDVGGFGTDVGGFGTDVGGFGTDVGGFGTDVAGSFATPDTLGGGLDTGAGGGFGGFADFAGQPPPTGFDAAEAATALEAGQPGLNPQFAGELATQGLAEPGFASDAFIGQSVGPDTLQAAENTIQGDLAKFQGGIDLNKFTPAGFSVQDVLAGDVLQTQVGGQTIPGFSSEPGLFAQSGTVISPADFNAEFAQLAKIPTEIASAGEAANIGAGLESFPGVSLDSVPGITVDSSGLAGAAIPNLVDTPAEIGAAAEGFGQLPTDVFSSTDVTGTGLPSTSSVAGVSPAPTSAIGASPVGGFVSPETALSSTGTGSISDIAAGDAVTATTSPQGASAASISPAVPGETTLESGFSNFSQADAAAAPVTNPAITNPNPFTDVGTFQPPQQIDSTVQGSGLNGPPANNSLNFGQGGLGQPAPITPATPGSPFAPGVTPNVPDIIDANTFQQLAPADDTLLTEEQPRTAGAFATPDLLQSAPITPADVGSPFPVDLTQQQGFANVPQENFGFTDVQNAGLDPNAGAPAGLDPNVPGAVGGDLSFPDFGLGPSTAESNLGIDFNTGSFPSGSDSFGFSGGNVDVASAPDLFSDIETGPQLQPGGAYSGMNVLSTDFTSSTPLPGGAETGGIDPLAQLQAQQQIPPFTTEVNAAPAGVNAPQANSPSIGTGLPGGNPAGPSMSPAAAAAVGSSNPLGNLFKGANIGQLAGLGAAGFLLANQPKVPSATNAAIANAGPLAALGQANIAQTQPTAIQQQVLDKIQQDAVNQARQMYFQQGRDPNVDSSYIQVAQNIALQNAALAAGFVQQANQLGVQELQGANATLAAAGQQQLQVQQNFNNSLILVATALGRLFGGSAASSASSGGAGAIAAAA